MAPHPPNQTEFPGRIQAPPGLKPRSYDRPSLRNWRVRARRGWAMEKSLMVRNTDGGRIDAMTCGGGRGRDGHC